MMVSAGLPGRLADLREVHRPCDTAHGESGTRHLAPRVAPGFTRPLQGPTMFEPDTNRRADRGRPDLPAAKFQVVDWFLTGRDHRLPSPAATIDRHVRFPAPPVSPGIAADNAVCAVAQRATLDRLRPMSVHVGGDQPPSPLRARRSRPATRSVES